jgi:endo-1,4-beta-xylanase
MHPFDSRLTRRTLLTGAATAAAMLPAAPSRSAAREVGVADEAGLDAVAARRGLFYGAAIDHEMLENDPHYMRHVRTECGVVVGEAAFKWADIHPEAEVYDFDKADALMGFARRHAKRVRGHTLVWHEANPDWLEHALTPATAETLLTRHIDTVAGHFRGHLMHWDVANEVLEPDQHQPLGLRDTLWLRALGPRYLDVAFHTCAATDPQALRVLNEYGLDYALPQHERKRAAMLTLLADLQSRNVPIQALGIQAHLDAAEIALDQTVLAKFVADIASLGLKVIVTELDVRDNRLPADPAARDSAVAAHAKTWLEPVLANAATLGVVTWGLSDRRSWLNKEFPRPDKLPQRPLPLDAELRRKALWASLGSAMQNAPARGVTSHS